MIMKHLLGNDNDNDNDKISNDPNPDPSKPKTMAVTMKSVQQPPLLLDNVGQFC